MYLSYTFIILHMLIKLVTLQQILAKAQVLALYLLFVNTYIILNEHKNKSKHSLQNRAQVFP